MRVGTVIAFSSIADAGVIEDANGDRYYFAATDWESPMPPGPEIKVNFVPASSRAKNVRSSESTH